MSADISQNLEEIRNWLISIPDPNSFNQRSQFMALIIQLMKSTLYVLKVGVSILPRNHPADRGYTKHRAIVLGHMIRLAKLYDGFLTHIEKKQFELAAIFSRLIYETEVRVDYFLNSKNKKQTYRSYVLTSYKSEKEILKFFKNKSTKEKKPIENYITKNISKLLRRDKITLKELNSNKRWDIDGKNFRELLRFLKRDSEYAFVFGSSSKFVHGSWPEINSYHLRKDGRYYELKLDYSEPDPRMAYTITYICLKRLSEFIKWNKSDVDDYLQKILLGLIRLTSDIDAAHKQFDLKATI